ncbi:MAG: ankyrin repeat domain-containing protein [Nitrospiraceae bacterium]|nr:MAG: ankyrin repeat domain-containing protein [Nitrospiraceae bacterium]
MMNLYIKEIQMIGDKNIKQMPFIALRLLYLLIVSLLSGCATTIDSQPTLHRAIREGDAELARQMIERRAYINVFDKDDMTPLMLALDNKQFELASLLIEKGADINARNRYGWSILHMAAYLDKRELADNLIVMGAEFKELDSNDIREQPAGTKEGAVRVADADLYINAQLYRFAAISHQQKGDQAAAIKNYKIASIKYDEASKFLKERHEYYCIESNKIKAKEKERSISKKFSPLSGLSMGASMIEDIGSLIKGDSPESIFEKIYAESYKKSTKYHLECERIIACYENNTTGNLSECFN